MKSMYGSIKILLIIDAVILVFAVIPAYLYLEAGHAQAIFIAAGLTSVYALIGAYYTSRYFNAPFETFMSKIFGAIFLRLIVLAASIFAVLKFSDLPEITFTLSVFISYISKSVQEIISIHKKSAQSNQPG